MRNVCDGYLVRSKIKGNYEAGLMSGGVLGSLEICDENKGGENEQRFWFADKYYGKINKIITVACKLAMFATVEIGSK